jgi:hypothetical protein
MSHPASQLNRDAVDTPADAESNHGPAALFAVVQCSSVSDAFAALASMGCETLSVRGAGAWGAHRLGLVAAGTTRATAAPKSSTAAGGPGSRGLAKRSVARCYFLRRI